MAFFYDNGHFCFSREQSTEEIFMLVFSVKSIYGLRAALTLAENYDQELMPIKEIAEKKHIPRQYLEQIFNQLGRAGIVQSVRGKHGGYRLAAHPSLIMVSKVIELLEGGIELLPATNGAVDVIDDLFQAARQRLLEVFEISLADLVLQQQNRLGSLHYDI